MALRGIKPTPAQKRLKALFYGAAGAGKTTAAIQMPSPYLIDTERGAENDSYVTLLNAAGGARFQSNDFEEIVNEVRALLSEPHSFRTLIIDPITTVYDDLIEKAEQKVGSDFGRHYGEAKKRWKRLANLLNRLDMNVIITSHEKNLYGDNLKVLGKTFDGPKGLDYLFDLVFEVAVRGRERVGVVRKTRVGGFLEGDIFPFEYAEIATRYGREVLERDAVVIQLATPEMVAEIEAVLAMRKDGEEIIEKLLTKAGADSLADLSAEQAQKTIDYYKAAVVAANGGAK